MEKKKSKLDNFLKIIESYRNLSEGKWCEEKVWNDLNGVDKDQTRYLY